jgi:cytochrome bd ubiquinol oxidase subunit I
MYFAAYIVAGFLVAVPYAWGFLRGRWDRYQRTALTVALSAAAVAAPLQVVIGDWAAREVAQRQPVKLASLEGLGQTTRGAPEHLLGWYNGHEVVYGIEIPRLLSLLAFHNPNAIVKGLNAVPAHNLPPINVVRIAFQTMIGIGTLLALLGLLYLYVRLRHKRLPRSRWFYRAVVLAGPLSVIALIAGWITTEVGRQPWIVYGIMRTTEAVTGASGIPVGYAMLIVVYLGLAGGVAWLLHRFSRVPLEPELKAELGADRDG